MKYYCETISADLAKKLKEKGMPIKAKGNNSPYPSYTWCFNWLFDKGAIIRIYKCKNKIYFPSVNNMSYPFYEGTWHEAANKAIEKALELI